MLYTKSQAEDFFGALRLATIEVLKNFGLPTSQGSKRYTEWEHGYPLGVTEHFTAGVGWKGSVSWLNDGPHENHVSCQMLILDRMLPAANEEYKKYSILSELEVAVLLLSDGIIPCWHAGWVNRLNFGIENRNAGMLRGQEGAWTWWPKNWKAKFPHEKLNKTPINIGGRWWEPYTHAQISANIIVGQMLYCLNGPDALDPRWFLPHSATSGRKIDTGRAFPIHLVRNAVFDQVYYLDLPWLASFEDDPSYMEDYDEEIDKEFLEGVVARQLYRDGDELPEGYELAEEPPDVDLRMLVDGGAWREYLGVTRRALHKLGYYVLPTSKKALDHDTALAVYQFQVAMGLKADKIPGLKTRKALKARIRQFH